MFFVVVTNNNTAMKKENKLNPTGPEKIADINPGSTTQGGSNFGQGANSLGKQAQQQGSRKGKGSDYENEQGWNNEALRGEDIQ
jgi:hypothetical protein